MIKCESLEKEVEELLPSYQKVSNFWGSVPEGDMALEGNDNDDSKLQLTITGMARARLREIESQSAFFEISLSVDLCFFSRYSQLSPFLSLPL